MTIVSVPTGASSEDLFWTITQKMQPLWAFRSGLRVENGVAFTLAGGDWQVRLGDAKITNGQGQGRVRGMVAEVEFCGDGEGEGEEVVDWDGREKMLKSFWESAVDGSEIGMDGLRVVVKVASIQKEGKDDLMLVRQYMELLKFARA